MPRCRILRRHEFDRCVFRSLLKPQHCIRGDMADPGQEGKLFLLRTWVIKDFPTPPVYSRSQISEKSWFSDRWICPSSFVLAMNFGLAIASCQISRGLGEMLARACIIHTILEFGWIVPSSFHWRHLPFSRVGPGPSSSSSPHLVRVTLRDPKMVEARHIHCHHRWRGKQVAREFEATKTFGLLRRLGEVALLAFFPCCSIAGRLRVATCPPSRCSHFGVCDWQHLPERTAAC